MKGADFRKLAEDGCRIYGDDPWFFFRELAQNARDAGASRIDIEARRLPSGEEYLRFTGDGTGMGLEEARRFLFRLYSSSKGKDRFAAGMYGIGFWSVLRFRSDHIVVESDNEKEHWGIAIDSAFELRRVDCRKEGRGTRVTMVRKAHYSTDAEYVSELTGAVRRYCRFLRRNDRSSTPLTVYVEGRKINESLRLSGPMTLSFREGAVEGAVGLAEKPKVELFARGLPVWHGVLLDELSHSAARQRWRSQVARGLSPVFLLNGNNLDVIMSRNAVIDNRALARVRRAARRALTRLVDIHLRQAFPVGSRGKLTRMAEGVMEWARSIRAVYLLGAVALTVVALLAYRFAPVPGELPASAVSRSESTETEPSDAVPVAGAGPRSKVEILPDGYRGAVVNEVRQSLSVDMSFDPPVSAWFKILTADRYEPNVGLLPRDGDTQLASSDFTCGGDCITVRLALPSGGATVLPAPSGFRVDVNSIRLDGAAAPAQVRTVDGAVLVTLPPKGGVVHYVTGPEREPRALTEEAKKALTAVPGDLPWPEGLDETLAKTTALPTDHRVLAAVTITRRLLDYDDSSESAALYRDLKNSPGWLQFVLATGRGDCDVLNGVTILLLRRLQVPSRLAVGLVGAKGKLAPGLHAWTEYYDKGWHAVDASRPVVEMTEGEEADRLLEKQGTEGGGASPLPPTLVAVGEGLTSGADTLPPFRPASRPAAGSSGHLPPPGKDTYSTATTPVASEAPSTASRRQPGWWPKKSIPPAVGEGTSADQRSSEGPAGGSLSQSIRQNLTPRNVVLVAAGLAALAALLMLLMGVKTDRWRQSASPADRKTAEKLLGQIAVAATVNPRAWSEARAIWFHPILPTLSGKRVSIKKAGRLAKRGKLFSGRQSSRLARLATGGGAVVLDRDSQPFAPLIDSLAGTVDLDFVEALETESSAVGTGAPLDRLLGRVNELLEDAGAKSVCLAAPGLTARDFQDVDLRGMSLPTESGWAESFIAVNPHGHLARQCVKLFEEDEGVGSFRFIDALARDSRLLSDRGEQLRWQVSRRVVEDAS